MVEAVTTFICVAAYQTPWWSFNKRNLTVESNSWTTPLSHLYYVCRLRETFQQGTAEMAPCWLHLVASFSHVFIIVHVKAIDQCPSVEHLKGLALVLVRAGPLSDCAGLYDPLSNHAGLLIDPLSDSAHPRPVLNRSDRFIIRLNS